MTSWVIVSFSIRTLLHAVSFLSIILNTFHVTHSELHVQPIAIPVNFLPRNNWKSAVEVTHFIVLQWLASFSFCIYEGVFKLSGLSHNEIYTLTTISTRWETTQRVTAAKLTRLTHKIAIQLHLVAESRPICSSRSRRPARNFLHTHSYMFTWEPCCEVSRIYVPPLE
jgi:hypothetical protein